MKKKFPYGAATVLTVIFVLTLYGKCSYDSDQEAILDGEWMRSVTETVAADGYEYEQTVCDQTYFDTGNHRFTGLMIYSVNDTESISVYYCGEWSACDDVLTQAYDMDSLEFRFNDELMDKLSQSAFEKGFRKSLVESEKVKIDELTDEHFTVSNENGVSATYARLRETQGD